MVPLELRERIVRAYAEKLTGSYEETAAVFRVGRATVSRLLRRHRETGGVQPDQVGGNNPRRIDLEWLRGHARDFPDARLIDRIDALHAETGKRVGSSTMSKAMRTIGWTHKKKRQ